MSFPRKLSALAVASTMAVTGVTMATPALANTGTSSQPAAAAP
ncbi:MAG: alpha/beta hydrolase, partial [Cutibacterium acnes]|nr:alpha/beta hydrolase [Cutibacterium acnes]